MIRVVPDTNILVSALYSKDGTPSRVAHLIPDRKITPCYSAKIMNEYMTVLFRPKFRFCCVQINALLGNIVKFGREVFVVESDVPFSDESDRVFYDVTKACDGVLITGNKRHYPAEGFVLTPAEFFLFFAGIIRQGRLSIARGHPQKQYSASGNLSRLNCAQGFHCRVGACCESFVIGQTLLGGCVF